MKFRFTEYNYILEVIFVKLYTYSFSGECDKKHHIHTAGLNQTETSDWVLEQRNNIPSRTSTVLCACPFQHCNFTRLGGSGIKNWSIIHLFIDPSCSQWLRQERRPAIPLAPNYTTAANAETGNVIQNLSEQSERKYFNLLRMWVAINGRDGGIMIRMTPH